LSAANIFELSRLNKNPAASVFKRKDTFCVNLAIKQHFACAGKTINVDATANIRQRDLRAGHSSNCRGIAPKF
jgi:hypothetical protein